MNDDQDFIEKEAVKYGYESVIVVVAAVGLAIALILHNWIAVVAFLMAVTGRGRLARLQKALYNTKESRQY